MRNFIPKVLILKFRNSDELGIVRFSGSHPIDFLDDAAAVESMNLVEKVLNLERKHKNELK